MHPSKCTKKIKWANTEFKCTLESFKVVPNYAITGHKTQGQTMDSIIVGSYRGHKFNNDGWIYVVLSRVNNINDLFTMELLDTDVRKYRERKYVKLENERLLALSENLSRRLRNI